MKPKIESMKKFKYLILQTLIYWMLFETSAIAQNTNYFYGAWEVVHLLDNAKPYSKPEIAEVKFIGIKKGKTKTTIYKFNSLGMITEHHSGKNGDTAIIKAKINYNEKNQIASSVFYKKKKMDFEYSFRYDESGKLSELSKTNEDSELKFKKNLLFNTNGDLSEQSWSYKKNGEINNYWKYEYHEKGKLSHTYYYKKGKLKKEWDYMCKEEGVEINKKNFFNVCQFHETKNDTLTMIYQSTNSKGKIEKSIYKFTLSDTLPLVQSHYNSKNELTVKYTYDKSFDKQTARIFYRNGKMKNEYYKVFSGDNVTSEKYIHNSKIIYSTDYSYDSKGYISEATSYGKKGKLKGKTSIEYTFR